MGRWLDSTMLPQACDLQLSSTVCKQINEGWKPNGMPPSISFEKFLEKIKASILSQPLQPNCASRPKTTGSTLAPRASGLQHHILYSNGWCRCHFVYDVYVEWHVKFTVSELLADSRVQLAHEHERFHPGWATQTDRLSFYKSSAAEFPTLAICCDGLDAPPVWQLGKGWQRSHMVPQHHRQDPWGAHGAGGLTGHPGWNLRSSHHLPGGNRWPMESHGIHGMDRGPHCTLASDWAADTLVHLGQYADCSAQWSFKLEYLTRPGFTWPGGPIVEKINNVGSTVAKTFLLRTKHIAFWYCSRAEFSLLTVVKDSLQVATCHQPAQL